MAPLINAKVTEESVNMKEIMPSETQGSGERSCSSVDEQGDNTSPTVEITQSPVPGAGVQVDLSSLQLESLDDLMSLQSPKLIRFDDLSDVSKDFMHQCFGVNSAKGPAAGVCVLPLDLQDLHHVLRLFQSSWLVAEKGDEENVGKDFKELRIIMPTFVEAVTDGRKRRQESNECSNSSAAFAIRAVIVSMNHFKSETVANRCGANRYGVQGENLDQQIRKYVQYKFRNPSKVPTILCRHCRTLLEVPHAFPLLSKSSNRRSLKLRCAACKKISKYCKAQSENSISYLLYRNSPIRIRQLKPQHFAAPDTTGTQEERSANLQNTSSVTIPKEDCVEPSHISDDNLSPLNKDGEISLVTDLPSETRKSLIDLGAREEYCKRSEKTHPSLPLPGEPPHVVCPHCKTILAVPVHLPESGTNKQRLRCGACMRVSIFSTSRLPDSNNADSCTSSELKSTTVKSSAASNVEVHDIKENTTIVSTVPTAQDSHRNSPTTDAQMQSPSNCSSREQSPSIIHCVKKTVKISGSSNIEFYRELQSNLQTSRSDDADSGMIQDTDYPTSTEIDKEALEQNILDYDIENTINDVEQNELSWGCESQRCTEWDLMESTRPPVESSSVNELIGNPSEDGQKLQTVAACTCTPLRPDVLALGFENFHDVFNPKQLLCIYSVSDDTVEMLFFHVQGMATFFGIGFPCCRVLMREDVAVEVTELRRQVWMDCWSQQEMSNFSLILFDSTKFSAELHSSSVDPVQSLSSKQAAEKFGVGLEGENLGKLGKLQQDLSNATAIPPSWIGELYQFLRLKGHSRQDGDDENKGSENADNSTNMTPNMSMPWFTCSGQEISSHETNESKRSIQGEEFVQVGAINHERQLQPLQLTVIIYLDRDNCTYYSAVDRTEIRLDTASSYSRFVHSETGKVIASIDPILCQFSMVPKVTINFLYYPHLEGGGSKKMKTTLDVEFLIDGNISDPDEFGWYHDQLRMSFKCSCPSEARREETEIISKNEIRTADRGYGRECSTLALKGKGREYQVFAGHKSFASLQMKINSKNESSVGSGYSQESSAKISAVCLMDANFSLRKVERPSELAYLATIFPPFHLYDVWDSVDRELAHTSGMMSAVPIQVKGGWGIREDGDNQDTSNTLGDSRERFCRYDFSCQRDIKLLRRTHVERPSKPRRSFYPTLSSRKPEVIIEIEEASVTIQQKLGRGFLINHSFSHMQRLERPHPYEWNMVGRPQAPCPRPVNQMVH